MASGIRLLNASDDGRLVVASATRIETVRPKSTIKKAFEAQAVFAPGATTSAVHSTVVAPDISAALATGRSVYVLSMGAEQSGKSTTVRGDDDPAADADGVAMLALDDVFSAADAATAACGAECIVTVSAVCCAIVPAHGETPLQGKQPVREVLIDALSDTPPSNAGLNVREHADGLPHDAPFYACLLYTSPSPRDS